MLLAMDVEFLLEKFGEFARENGCGEGGRADDPPAWVKNADECFLSSDLYA